MLNDFFVAGSVGVFILALVLGIFWVLMRLGE